MPRPTIENYQGEGSVGVGLENQEWENRKNALIYDVTQPYVFENERFSKIIIQEIERLGEPPCVVELACGTGLLGTKVIEAFPGLTYHGYDLSVEMVKIFEAKLSSSVRAKSSVTFYAPVDLRREASLAGIRYQNANILLISQFTQYLPTMTSSQAGISRRDFLHICADSLVRPGKMFVIEDVAGETEAEHEAFSRAWDEYVRIRYKAYEQQLKAALDPIAPDFAGAISTMVANPSLIGLVRKKRRAARGEEVVPLSEWKRIFENLELSYRMERHDALRNFYLFMFDVL